MIDMKKQELLKIAKPILLTGEMVQAILSNRKTVTRRLIKPQPPEGYDYSQGLSNLFYAKFLNSNSEIFLSKPPYMAPNPIEGKVGDILYVRETWLEADDGIYYRADETPVSKEVREKYGYKWRPSIHMPKPIARIFLKVTDVRVERLRDITEEQALREGVTGFRCECNGNAYACTNCFNNGWLEPPQLDFMYLWNSTIKKQDLDKYGWEVNPWVWVIEFERVEVEE